jgi:hypothetical protein
MTKPTIHMNGTHPRDLYDAYFEAAHALRTALEKVAASGPNGRDYYPQEPGAIHIAQDEQEARLAKLREVLSEIEELLTHVATHV